MSDFYEIDFLDVETAKSGDAITLRYRQNGITSIHVVDGGFQDTGPKVVDHIRKYYSDPLLPPIIDRVVVSHPDGDHAGGLRTVLESFRVRELWMLRPWLYANEIISQFVNYSSVESLQRRLKTIYPNIAALESLAIERGIPIYAPFQGAVLGAFVILAPSKGRYLNLIVSSERTPESVEGMTPGLALLLRRTITGTVNLFKAAWGTEVFSSEDTSAENEMSTVQYANICGKRILLTADAGRSSLTEAATYAPFIGLQLPGIDRFQVPHHGSRRNISTEILDRWLGPRFLSRLQPGKETFTAIISSAKKDEDHPRKSVIRACIHRGAKVITTEGRSICISQNHPPRDWISINGEEYPEEQEED